MPSSSLLPSSSEFGQGSLDFDPSIIAFGDDGHITGIDERRKYGNQGLPSNLEEQNRQLEEMRARIERTERLVREKELATRQAGRSN